MESLAMTGRTPEATLLRSWGRISFWIDDSSVILELQISVT
jgi:hypothetical protein